VEKIDGRGPFPACRYFHERFLRAGLPPVKDDPRWRCSGRSHDALEARGRRRASLGTLGRCDGPNRPAHPGLAAQHALDLSRSGGGGF